MIEPAVTSDEDMVLLRQVVDRLVKEEVAIAASHAAMAAVRDPAEGTLCICERGLIVYADDVVSMMAGYAPGELLKQPLEVLIGRQHRDAWAAVFHGYVESGALTQGWKNPLAFPLQMKDGSDRPMIIRAFERPMLGRRMLVIQVRAPSVASAAAWASNEPE